MGVPGRSVWTRRVRSARAEARRRKRKYRGFVAGGGGRGGWMRCEEGPSPRHPSSCHEQPPKPEAPYPRPHHRRVGERRRSTGQQRVSSKDGKTAGEHTLCETTSRPRAYQTTLPQQPAKTRMWKPLAGLRRSSAAARARPAWWTIGVRDTGAGAVVPVGVGAVVHCVPESLPYCAVQLAERVEVAVGRPRGRLRERGRAGRRAASVRRVRRHAAPRARQGAERRAAATRALWRSAARRAARDG